MDSKSISPKGSKGSIPFLGTNTLVVRRHAGAIARSETSMTDSGRRRAIGERLAAGLLPALLHRVQNTTQLLVGLRALVEIAPDDVPERCCDGLCDASRETHTSGWLMGLLAGALGADMLRSREERGGLEPVLTWLRDSLRRREIVLEFRSDELPQLGVGAKESAEFCLTLMALVWESSVELPHGSRVEIAFTSAGALHEVHVSGSAAAAAARALREWRSRDDGSRVETRERGWTWRVPNHALEFHR